MEEALVVMGETDVVVRGGKMVDQKAVPWVRERDHGGKVEVVDQVHQNTAEPDPCEVGSVSLARVEDHGLADHNDWGAGLACGEGSAFQLSGYCPSCCPRQEVVALVLEEDFDCVHPRVLLERQVRRVAGKPAGERLVAEVLQPG